jgi:hypothetical protein
VDKTTPFCLYFALGPHGLEFSIDGRLRIGEKCGSWFFRKVFVMTVDTDALYKEMVKADSSNRTQDAVRFAKQLLAAMDDLEPVPKSLVERSRYPNLDINRDVTRSICRQIMNQSGRGTAGSTGGGDCP